MRETGTVYGNSLYALAAEEGIAEEIKAQLDVLSEIYSESGDFFSMLDAPQLQKEEKLKVADAVFDGCHPYIINTIKLLIENRNISAFGYLVKAYEKAYNKANGIEKATAVTAVPLDEGAKEALRQKLEKLTGKKIILNSKVDPSILGGVVIRADGMQIDGGVKGRLEEIKKEIVR